MEKERYGFILCVCTGKCPGFQNMDIWDFINQVRVELPVEYGFIHPQLCEEDGDRFLADFLKTHRKLIIGACAPTMQKKMLKQAFIDAGLILKRILSNWISGKAPLYLNGGAFIDQNIGGEKQYSQL